jgi:hypothetical protein
VSELLTPASLIQTLSGIGRSLDDKSAEIADLDANHVALRVQFKREFAREFLTMAGSNDVRRYSAELATADLLLEAEMAEQVLRAGRESLRVLRDRLEIGRSLGALLRVEWNA